MLVLAAALPLTLFRSGLESNLWIDEIHSLVLTLHPLPRLVELAAGDIHPPLWTIALKAWNALGRALFDALDLGSIGPGWARGMNLLAGLGAVALAAWIARRRFGAMVALLLAASLAWSAWFGLFARDLRGYGVAAAALLLAWLAVEDSLHAGTGDRPDAWTWRGWRRWRPAASLTAAATVAVWIHLLAAPALVCLVLIGVAVAPAGRRLRVLFDAAVAGAVTVLAFLPWLLVLPRQVATLEAAAPAWMTPATAGNLLLVPSLWWPLSRLEEASPSPLLVGLGILSWLFPLGALLLAVGARRPGGTGPEASPAPTARLLRAALLAGGTALAFLLVLWILARTGTVAVFHGPRYPALVAYLWAAALTLAAVVAVRRLGWHRLAAAGLLLPWWIAGVTGQGILALRETGWGLAGHLHQAGDLLPPAGDPVVVQPVQLAPFFESTLTGGDPGDDRPGPWAVASFEEVACAGPSLPHGLTVIDLNFWKAIDLPRDRLTHRLLVSGRLGPTRSVALPAPQGDFTVYRIEPLDRAVLEALCRRGGRSLAVPGGATAWATPEAQQGGGWSWLELQERGAASGNPLPAFRWTTAPRVELTFEGMPGGDPQGGPSAVLVITGIRTGEPAPAVPVRVFVDGRLVGAETVAAGPFSLRVPVILNAEKKSPRVEVVHPTWNPAAGRRRSLGFAFTGAWWEPAAGEVPGRDQLEQATIVSSDA